MDPKIIGAIGLMMVCCSSLSVFMMGGEETPNPDPKGGADDSGTGADDSGTGADDSETGADDSETGADDSGTDAATTPAATTTPSPLHICVQSERNWINGKITHAGWTKLQGEEAMSCTMTETELEPCNVAQTNWINAVIEQGTHSPTQAERAMNGCVR
jgi:hypothetical protein